MKQVEERYISLLTDFGFKRIFGTAMNKDLLICFLNSLFNGRQVVKDVSYLNPPTRRISRTALSSILLSRFVSRHLRGMTGISNSIMSIQLPCSTSI